MRKAFLFLAVLVPLLCIGAAAFSSTVDIAAPPNGSTISGDSVQIVINFEVGDLTPATKLDVRLDGKAVTHREFSSAKPSGSSTFKWDTTRTPNGKHMLDITVSNGENVLGTAACEVTVSNQSPEHFAPSVKVVNLKEGQTVTGTASIIVEAADDAGNDPLVSISIDKSVRSVSNRAPFKYDWDTTAYGNGPHYIDVSAIDDSNLTTKTKTIRVLVRNQSKVLPLTSKSHGDTLNMPTMPLLASKAKQTPKVASAALPKANSESARAAENDIDESKVASAPTATSVKSLPVLTVDLPKTSVDESQVNSAPKPAVKSTVKAKSNVSAAASTSSMEEELPALSSELKSELHTTATSATMASVPAVKSNAHGSAAKVDGVLSLAGSVSGSHGQPAAAMESARIAVPGIPVASAKNTVGSVSAKTVLAGKIAENTIRVSAVSNTDKLMIPDAPRMSGASTVSKLASKPVLMAKLVKSDSEPQIKSDRRASAPCGRTSSMKKSVQVAKACNCCDPCKCAATAQPCAKKSGKCSCKKAVGVRAAFKAAGGTVAWDGDKKTVHATAPEKDLKIKIGSKQAEFNSKSVSMDRAAFICNGRTMISGSFASKTLKMDSEKK